MPCLIPGGGGPATVRALIQLKVPGTTITQLNEMNTGQPIQPPPPRPHNPHPLRQYHLQRQQQWRQQHHLGSAAPTLASVGPNGVAAAAAPAGAGPNTAAASTCTGASAPGNTRAAAAAAGAHRDTHSPCILQVLPDNLHVLPLSHDELRVSKYGITTHRHMSASYLAAFEAQL